MSNQVFTRVREVQVEGKELTTLRFRFGRRALPGQFVMVWLPGVDEIPMSLSYVDGLKGITIKDVGEATRALSSLHVGDSIALRGPFGRYFELSSGRSLFVCGGIGAASVMPAAEAVRDTGKVDIAIGARTKDEVIFEERAKRCSADVRTSTDDGTCGMRGTAVDLARLMMEEKKYGTILACGPEIMLNSLLELGKAHGVKCQFSLERLMKCGVGLCGSCVLDDRRVCTDGPVFWGHELESMSEFGKCKRDEAGLKVRL
ncbi:MAG: dihydroorotate dehydrogenase electron transfer subunit [Methanomassiliicoccales archaeon]|jgi:dihydroorotate dehydrogenase electron transfer subunit